MSDSPVLSGPELRPDAPTHAIVFLHGYGADGEDLIELAYPLMQLLPPKLQGKIAFFSPHAPHETVMGMGRQWFSDNNFTFRDKPGIEHAKELLENYLVDYIGGEIGVPMDKIALVGFSQGTMTALFAAPRFKGGLAGVVGFSGLLQWAEDLEEGQFNKMPMLLVHGADDDVVPADKTPEAAQKLAELGFDVESHILPHLAHGINPEGLTLAAEFITKNFLK